MARPDILLAAKPWKGGLAYYVLEAMQTLFGADRVVYVPTYPRGLRERLRYYQRGHNAWRNALVERINAIPYRVGLFINDLAEYEGLDERRTNVLWLTDAPSISVSIAKRFCRIFLSDPGYADDLKKVCGSDRYAGVLPFAHSPTVHRPEPEKATKRDLCFIGNKDPERDPYISALVASRYRFTVVGNYFMRHPIYWRSPGSFRPAIPNSKMGKIYARHHLALNLHAAVVRMGSNMRTFECAGYGIPQLVHYRPRLEHYFEPDKEIAIFHTVEEMLEGIADLLANPEKARRMAKLAQRRAQAEHTYVHRIKQAFAGI